MDFQPFCQPVALRAQRKPRKQVRFPATVSIGVPPLILLQACYRNSDKSVTPKNFTFNGDLKNLIEFLPIPAPEAIPWPALAKEVVMH
jgi:hypothetical protein